MARAAERVFGVYDGTDEQKARQFVDRYTQWIHDIGITSKISECEGVVMQEGDIDKLTDMVWNSVNCKPFGFHGCITKEFVREVFQESLTQ